MASQVQYCISRKLDFIAQNGAHGWANTFRIGNDDVLINLRGLNSVKLSSDKQSITLGGGALVKDVIDVAAPAGVQVQVGNCNCVGVLGAALGGGYGNLAGQYGLSVDNLISVKMVTGQGKLITVTPDDEDLWWAIRGAAPNFGIVTSATMKAYPVANTSAWIGSLVFTPAKLEALVQAFNEIELRPRMRLFLYFATSGPPSFTPTILAQPYYAGSAAEGKAAFASLYALGPAADQMAEVPYSKVNDATDGLCTKGGRKPGYSAGIAKLDPKTWRETWEMYLEFLKIPGTGNSGIIVEGYPVDKPKPVSNSPSAYSFGSVPFWSLAVPWYNETSLDPIAEAFGSKLRDMWYTSGGLPANRT